VNSVIQSSLQDRAFGLPDFMIAAACKAQVGQEPPEFGVQLRVGSQVEK
jgi:hypothetical protein